jgi:hypothetical protein
MEIVSMLEEEQFELYICWQVRCCCSILRQPVPRQ